MKSWQILTIVILLAVAATTLTASAFAYMNGRGVFNPYGGYSGMMGGYGGMMSGYGYNYGYPETTTPIQPGTVTNDGGCGFNGNNYASPTYANGTFATPLNITTAETIANNYLASLNNPNLTVKEIEEYSQNFYVQYYERSTGIGAFEMLIDKNTGAIYPEMGPNMMWNTKYGMMSGSGYGGMMGAGSMMGGYGYSYGNGYTGTPAANMPVSTTQANADAQQWLNSNIAGATVGEVSPLYGYYHVMVQINGSNYGMLSVNGYTGQVWYHTWHGTFIQEA